MIAPIGLFRAYVTDVDRLIQTTVGRKEMLEDLLEKLERSAGKKGGQHYIFIGPRGIGKTHFLSLVENAAQTRDALKRYYTVIRFPEENNRILSFADILLQIAAILAEQTSDEKWQVIHTALSVMDKDQEIVDTMLPRLKQFRKESGKILLLLMENLDVLFVQQIKDEQDIHRFRTFLMDSPCATLIGTSPVFFPGLASVQKPFFDFFDIQVLEYLSEELTIDLVKKNLQLEKRQDLLDTFNQLLPKIKALHTMTGGNPRLIMMLYELIAYDNILDVKVQFEKLLDQITPFYQDRMKEFAPQERALLETMALMRTAQRTPAAIAARMRKSPQQVSSLLKRMLQAGYLTAADNPRDKRSRIYRIKEGFFDLWLAMSESRSQRKRLGYLVKLFEVWYQDRMERETKRLELRQALQKDQSATDVRENRLEYLDYLSDIGDGDERCQAKLELAIDQLQAGAASKAKDLLMEIKPLAPVRGIFTWMTDQVHRWSDSSLDIDIVQWFEGLIQYWKIQRAGDLEKAVDIAQRLGMDLSEKGLHTIRIELLKDALESAAHSKDKINLYIQMARSQKTDGQLKPALFSLEKALNLCKKTGDRSGEGATLNNISQIYDARGDYDTALEYLKQSLVIRREIGDRSGEGTTLNNISQIFKVRGDYDTALDYLKQSLSIVRDIGNRSGEGATLNNISEIYDARGDYDTALDYLKQSLTIFREIGDRSGFCYTLFNLGHNHIQNKEIGEALSAWTTVYGIAREIQLSDVLTHLDLLARKMGQDGLAFWEALLKQQKVKTARPDAS
ncbi:MAG: tetratricopeptide repeat protein [Pseudomonadota bacterium]